MRSIQPRATHSCRCPPARHQRRRLHLQHRVPHRQPRLLSAYVKRWRQKQGPKERGSRTLPLRVHCLFGLPAGPVYPHLRMTLPSTTFCPSDHMQFASAELGVSSGSPFRNIGTPPCPLVTQEPEMMDWRGGTTGTTATVKVRTLSHSIWAPRLETLKALAAREDRKHTGQ